MWKQLDVSAKQWQMFADKIGKTSVIEMNKIMTIRTQSLSHTALMQHSDPWVFLQGNKPTRRTSITTA